MQTIIITSEKNRHYTLRIDGKPAGTLHYPNWYSQDAEIMVGESAYTIQAKGFWKIHGEVIKDGNPLFEVKTKWRGTVITRAKEMHHFYTLKPKGWFSWAYILESYKGEEVLQLKQEFTWKKLASNYIVTAQKPFEGEDGLLLLLVAAHYYRAAMNTAATATVDGS
ncbi:hypothetical protein OGH69_06015 [Flavobacterium sp. MFBS3-15]|uniref:hypothetical protein n=1 Tax=Flavobacterium sp. MFBS3-15 TaxID=2989816 RepID=UPI0022358665|nr:hypothetical protein [Flavobacterium sp. MFBS3-15]MCW4468510.1 hypothetical protein [Flavobacterium sp. MFBS3-15]